MTATAHRHDNVVTVRYTRSALLARRAAAKLVSGDERLGAAVRLPDGFIYPVLEFDVGLLDAEEMHALCVLEAAMRLTREHGVAGWQR